MKLLACDLDGTLVETEINKIRKEDIQAVKKLREHGNKFIISTGRDLRGIHKIFSQYDDFEFDYLVLCNGAMILDNNYNIIYKNTLSHDFVQEIYNDFYGGDDIAMYVTYDENSSIFFTGEPKEFSDFLGEFKCINNENEVFSVERTYNLISIFSKSKNYENAESIKNSLIEKHKNNFGIFRNQAFVDIVGKNCSKGSALKKVIEMEGWDISKLYAIGDSFNDISMFEITENSFTFHHAEDRVKAAANNKVNFVYECIEEILNA